MTRNDSLDEARHPIGVAARRTGVTPAALRAWERRYGAVVPARSEGGQRLYSDRELRRLKLLREAVEGGRAISRVVDLEADELAELVEADRRAASPARGPVPGTGVEVEPGPILGQAMEAVEELAPKALEEALRRGAVTLSPSALVEEVLVPLLREIGEQWRSGDLRPAAEHLASTVIRRFLEWLTEAAEVSTGAPLMLAATPAGQRHEFGALLAAVTGALAGWRVVYLGPDLPGREIAAAARKTGSALVVLSALVPGEPAVAAEVAALVEDLPSGVRVVAGGPAVEAVRDEVEGLGVRYVADFAGFREFLSGRKVST